VCSVELELPATCNYTEGYFDEPVYFEFAVETEGKDDGSIVVNVDRTELVVPEINVGGVALFKMYEDLVDLDEVFLIRHNAFRSLAFNKKTANAEPSVIAYAGFDGGEPTPKEIGGFYNEYRTQSIRTKTRNKRKAMIVARSPEERRAFDLYYKTVDQQLAEVKDGGDECSRSLHRHSMGRMITPYSWMSQETLSHIYGWIGGHAWRLPQFFQTTRTRHLKSCDYICIGEEPVGCTNRAFASVFAYWDSFHSGFSYLFEGPAVWRDETCCGVDSEADGVMWRLNELLDTSEGWTSHAKYLKAVDYLKERGHCGYIDRDAHANYYQIEEDIREDKPVILSVDADADVETDYVVAISSAFSRYRVACRDGSRAPFTLLEQAFYVNWGSTSQKWIVVPGNPLDGEQYHATSTA